MKSLRLAFGNPPPFSREAKSFQTAMARLALQGRLKSKKTKTEVENE